LRAEDSRPLPMRRSGVLAPASAAAAASAPARSAHGGTHRCRGHGYRAACRTYNILMSEVAASSPSCYRNADIMTVTDDKKVAESRPRHEWHAAPVRLTENRRAHFIPRTTRRFTPRRRLRAALPGLKKADARCWCLARQFEVTRELPAKMDFRSL